MTTLHGALTGADNMHVPYAWTFANQASREAGIGIDASGVGKLARQLDDNSLWLLVGTDPITWKQAGGGSFPSGTRMLFQQTTAPTGWTKDTAVNDRALRVVSGAVGSGGSIGFSTLFGRTTVDWTTLVASQMPSHGHSLRVESNAVDSSAPYTQPYLAATNSSLRTATNASNPATASGSVQANGGNGSHTHGLDLRLAYLDVIVARKD